MKKIFALLLCCLLPLLMLAGCNKEESTPEPPELTDDIVAKDLSLNHSRYNKLYFMGNSYAISNLEVSDKEEKDNTVTLTASATAANNSISYQLTASMVYALEGNFWVMKNIEVLEAEHTILGNPDQGELLEALENYYSITGSALALQGEEEYKLNFNPVGAEWTVTSDLENKTAKVAVSFKSTELTFEGYYNLTLGENGWSFESQLQEDGRSFPILYLEKLEQKSK